MWILAAVNVYRWEALAGLWLRRRFMRTLLRSSRDQDVARVLDSPDGAELFAFRRLVGSREEAILMMAYSSFTGSAVGMIIGGMFLTALSRSLGFPDIFVFLAYFVALCSWVTMVIGYATAKLGPAPPENPAPEYNGDIGWEFDIERNPRVGLGVSIWGILVSLVGAWSMLVYLPHPSTWG